MTFYHAGVQPTSLYCRRTIWAEGKSPTDGQTSIEVTDDVVVWDKWVDELSKHRDSGSIERVELFASASIEWGQDLAPQMLRIMDRISRR